MKDMKSVSHRKPVQNTKFYASFLNRQPGTPIKFIEVTVVCSDRKQAKELAKTELIPLAGYTFVDLD